MPANRQDPIDQAAKIGEMPETMRERVLNYWTKMGRLNLASGLFAQDQLRRNAAEQAKNQEAESAHVRRTMWGSEEEPVSEAEEMGDTILGDQTITHPTPIVMPPSNGGSSFLKTAAAVALGAMVPGGFILGSLLDWPEDEPAATERVDVGLGKIEDYIRLGDQ